MPLCMDFFLESLMFRNVQHVLTFHGRTFATLQVGEENGQQAAGIQVLAPAFQGRVGTWQEKIRGCIEIILLLGSDSINLNNQRVIQMAIFHGYVIGLI